MPTAADAATWRGKTRQGRLAQVVTGADGSVTKVRIRYRARCGDRKTLTSGVRFQAPLDTATAAAFEDGGRFEFDLPNGEHARARTSVDGGLRSSGRWTGNFRIRVRVTRNGRYVATCRTGRIGWKASPAIELGAHGGQRGAAVGAGADCGEQRPRELSTPATGGPPRPWMVADQARARAAA